jgi:hypothetical protein
MIDMKEFKFVKCVKSAHHPFPFQPYRETITHPKVPLLSLPFSGLKEIIQNSIDYLIHRKLILFGTVIALP